MQGKELNFTKVGYPIHDWSVRKSGEKLGKNVSKFNIQSKIITISFKGLYKRGPLFTVFLKMVSIMFTLLHSYSSKFKFLGK